MKIIITMKCMTVLELWCCRYITVATYIIRIIVSDYCC